MVNESSCNNDEHAIADSSEASVVVVLQAHPMAENLDFTVVP